MRKVFQQQGRAFDKSVAIALKNDIAKLVEQSPGNALQAQRSGPIGSEATSSTRNRARLAKTPRGTKATGATKATSKGTKAASGS